MRACACKRDIEREEEREREGRERGGRKEILERQER